SMAGLVFLLFPLAVVYLLTSSVGAAEEASIKAAANLVRNPGLEAPLAGALPVGWEPLNIGAKSQFAVDANERHEGRQSVRIRATEVARSYLRSDLIPVVPGEQIAIGAWVKVRDVPPDQGTVIAIAEFDNSAGAMLEVGK